jgi:hypothetical protein
MISHPFHDGDQRAGLCRIDILAGPDRCAHDCRVCVTE